MENSCSIRGNSCLKNWSSGLCTFELRSKVLPLGKTQIHLVFRSLIRTFAPKIVTPPLPLPMGGECHADKAVATPHPSKGRGGRKAGAG